MQPRLHVLVGPFLWIASGRVGEVVGIGAERAESGDGVGDANHGGWPSGVLPVERRWLGHVEAASHSVIGIVEPETDIERIEVFLA